MSVTNYFTCIVLACLIWACNGSDNDDSNDNQQNIVTSDSSGITGRLTVEVRRDADNGLQNNADVNLYLTYEDVLRNIPLYELRSQNGSVDFGFIIQGNYYITGMFYNGVSTIRDTTVAQILPRRTATRVLYLR